MLLVEWLVFLHLFSLSLPIELLSIELLPTKIVPTELYWLRKKAATHY
jgi:hypothetical protein